MPTIATRLLFAACLTWPMLGSSPAWAAHATESPVAQASTPAPASRFVADPALRTAMENIVGLIDKQYGAIEKGTLPGPAYKDSAAQVERHLASIDQNSKLDPPSEKAWRMIRSDMQHGLEWMRQDKPDLQRVGALALIQAVRNYGRYFDHPGLKRRPMASDT